MIEGEKLYQDACEAGDMKTNLRGLTDNELRQLHAHTAAMVSRNASKGGIPAVVKWSCAFEAAERFLATSKKQP